MLALIGLIALAVIIVVFHSLICATLAQAALAISAIAISGGLAAAFWHFVDVGWFVIAKYLSHRKAILRAQAEPCPECTARAALGSTESAALPASVGKAIPVSELRPGTTWPARNPTVAREPYPGDG